MAREIKTSIDIDADCETVYTILTDFESYPEWNPFIKSLTGEVKVGSRIKVRLQGMTFTPTVLVLQKNSEFKWLGHFGFKGLFDGEHRFRLTKKEDGGMTFEQSEKFTGILVGLFSKMLNKTEMGFVQMNEALKAKVED